MLTHTEAGKLIMDKSKKLRLKRRIPQQKSKITSTVELRDEDVETVTLSSDSEGDGRRPSKQRKITHTANENVSSPNAKGFLETDNPSLNRLREMILSLSPKVLDTSKLSPFPAFHTQIQENNTMQEKLANLCKGRLKQVAKSQSGDDLSPFPKLCKHYRKTSKMNSNETSVDKVKEGFQETLKTETEDKRETISSMKIVTDLDNENEIKASTSYNTCKSYELKARTSNNTYEFREDNSAIIRDRNSNFYSLQSRNTCRNLGDKSGHQMSNTYHPNKTIFAEKNNKDRLQKERSSSQASESTSCFGASINNNMTIYRSKFCDINAQDEVNSALLHGKSSLPEKYHSKEGSRINNLHTKKFSSSILKTNSSDMNSSSVRKKDSFPFKQVEDLPLAGTANEYGNVVGTTCMSDNVTLQSCPLCQMKFNNRISQMELDSHIAACLSTSEDDVIW